MYVVFTLKDRRRYIIDIIEIGFRGVKFKTSNVVNVNGIDIFYSVGYSFDWIN